MFYSDSRVNLCSVILQFSDFMTHINNNKFSLEVEQMAYTKAAIVLYI